MFYKLSDFYKIHENDKIIVCGCGISLNNIIPYHSEFITIGVNDVPLAFDPTYMVITDSIHRFSKERQKYISSSNCKAFFTCVNGWIHNKLVHFELGSTSLNHLDDTNRVDYFMNSPYVGVNIAYKMGAKYIGLIGVDFTNGHFYNENDGPHPLSKQDSIFEKIKNSYILLKEELEKRNVFLLNLSKVSKIDLPKITIEEFKKL